MSCGGLPALLPKTSPATGPYMTSNKALQHVLSVCSTKNVRPKLVAAADAAVDRLRVVRCSFGLPRATLQTVSSSGWRLPCCGLLAKQVPPVVAARCLWTSVSLLRVRPRSQEELRADVTWSQKKSEHWDPASSPVYLLIEEPLNGENVARCVKPEGFTAIQKEVRRGIQSLGPMGSRRVRSEVVQGFAEAFSLGCQSYAASRMVYGAANSNSQHCPSTL